MENIADVLKIFFAVAVFVIALTVLFQMTALAKDTADAVFVAIDRNTYMDYNSYEIDGANRKVTFQEIIPTIYRYAQEGYGVTIIDNGQIVARFDLDTESQVASCFWTEARYVRASENEKKRSDTIKSEIVKHLNTYIFGKLGYGQISEDNIDDLITKIYSTGDTTGVDPVYTSWLNSNTYQNNNITQRVNCDIYGGTTNFSLRNPGIHEDDSDLNKPYIAGKHKAVCYGNGLLKQYGDSDLTFTEYIVQIDRNNYIAYENEENTGLLVFGEIRYTKKREIIYVKN